jgi:hypothetical protein
MPSTPPSSKWRLSLTHSFWLSSRNSLLYILLAEAARAFVTEVFCVEWFHKLNFIKIANHNSVVLMSGVRTQPCDEMNAFQNTELVTRFLESRDLKIEFEFRSRRDLHPNFLRLPAIVEAHQAWD